MSVGADVIPVASVAVTECVREAEVVFGRAEVSAAYVEVGAAYYEVIIGYEGAARHSQTMQHPL